MPTVSIVIRTFNEEQHIRKVLRAVRSQEYRDYEVILVDSGSIDSTKERAAPLCDRIVDIDGRDFTFGYSLNVGCRNVQGEFLVFLSAHAIPADEQWLAALIAPFEDPKIAMTFGRQVGHNATKFSESRDFERFFGSGAHAGHPWSYFTNNANSAIRSSLWREHQFDEYLTGLEDIAWTRQMIKRGYNVMYVPKAEVYHIHVEKWSQVYNRYRREAIAASNIDLPHPPLGSPCFGSCIKNIVQDLWAGRKVFLPGRVRDIFYFRYYQWQGARQGWYRDRNIDINQEREALFFAGVNQGVVVEQPHIARFKELPIPDVKPSDVLIKVGYVGVCRTDLEVHEGMLGYYKTGIAKYPIVPGHEFAGQIVRLGANCSATLKVGDRVVGECILSCGACQHCGGGSHIACAKRQEVGVMNYHGAYAQFVTLPARFVHKIPEGMSLKIAVLTEPLAVVLRALRRAGPRLSAGSRCAVVGAGPIGNLCAQVLHTLGCAVTVFNRSEPRLHILKDIVETRRTLADLDGFDIIVEASGSIEALKEILSKSRANVTIILLGFPYGSFSYNFEELVGQEKVIVGSVGGTHEDFENALTLLPKLDTRSFTQRVLPLRDFADAWELHRSGEHLKIILKANNLKPGVSSAYE